MNNEFIPYEQALELKKLGFDEPCIAGYDGTELKSIYRQFISHEPSIHAPLYQQAFRWFREKYGLFLLNDYGVAPHFTIMQNLFVENLTLTYEEAELACLKKLIEIVKNK